MTTAPCWCTPESKNTTATASLVVGCRAQNTTVSDRAHASLARFAAAGTPRFRLRHVHPPLAAVAVTEQLQSRFDPESFLVRVVNEAPMSGIIPPEQLKVIGGPMPKDVGGVSR